MQRISIFALMLCSSLPLVACGGDVEVKSPDDADHHAEKASDRAEDKADRAEDKADEAREKADEAKDEAH
jgi:hypothetical protein